MPSKKWVISGGILLLLIFLNPGIGRFKEFSGLIGKDSHYIKRKYNFLICSIYEDSYNDKKYFGFLLNFINITPKRQKSDNSDYLITNSDSTAVITRSDTTTIQIPPFLNDSNPGKIKMKFQDGSIGDIDTSDFKSAIAAGAKLLNERYYITPNGTRLSKTQLINHYGKKKTEYFISEGLAKLDTIQ